MYQVKDAFKEEDIVAKKIFIVFKSWKGNIYIKNNIFRLFSISCIFFGCLILIAVYESDLCEIPHKDKVTHSFEITETLAYISLSSYNPNINSNVLIADNILNHILKIGFNVTLKQHKIKTLCFKFLQAICHAKIFQK